MWLGCLSKMAHSLGCNWCSWWLSSTGVVNRSTQVWPLHVARASHSPAAGLQEWVFWAIRNRRCPLHSVTSVIFYWSSSNRIHLDLKGGIETPLLNGRRIEGFVTIFSLPECLWLTLCLAGDLHTFTFYIPCQKRVTYCCVVRGFPLASEYPLSIPGGLNVTLWYMRVRTESGSQCQDRCCYLIGSSLI